MQKIELKNLEFYAYHGCFPEEIKIGTWFSVDISLDLDFTEAAINDNLSKTINYLDIFKIVKKIMNIPVNTLEHLNNKICKEILEKYQLIQKIEVKVSKLNPPLGGKIQSVSVIQIKTR